MTRLAYEPAGITTSRTGSLLGATSANPTMPISVLTHTHRVGKDVRRSIPSIASAAQASSVPTSST
ncbi:MAG: hypothetical protein ABI625_07165 [bacterium]